MNDLETLRPEVAEAVAAIDGGNGVFVNSDDGIGSAKWQIVRAELLRLARENDEWQTRCLQFQTERDMARAELAAVKARIAEAPRADGQHVFDLLCLPIEYDGTLALVKVEE